MYIEEEEGQSIFRTTETIRLGSVATRIDHTEPRRQLYELPRAVTQSNSLRYELMRQFIQTYTGRRVGLLDPDPADITIEDISYSLARLCRFGGHCRSFYSVAQHSVLVSTILEDRPLREDYNDWDLLMQGLLHDASEAYVMDLPSPIKQLLPKYKEIELGIEEAIWIKFGLNARSHLIKQADNIALATETKQLMVNTMDWSIMRGITPDHRKIVPLSPVDAETDFVKQFYFLKAHLPGRRDG